MKAAGKSGARVLLIVGEDEWKQGIVALKDSKTGAQQAVAVDRLAETLRAILPSQET